MSETDDQAVEFLAALYPEGLRVLTAIEPDRKGIETRTFLASDSDGARTWIAKYNGKRNVYVHANQPRVLLTKKADKRDIATAHYLYVDIDPRAGEALDEEQRRILALIESWAQPFAPPHIAVWSGGGMQLWWRLHKHVEIGGLPEAWSEYERYNRALELALGGDTCHNVDRILRLPGTLNIPDEKKVKKGRAPAMAEVIFMREGTVALDDMPKAPQQQASDTDSPARRRRSSVGTGTSITDLSTLDEWRVTDKLKTVIEGGALPDDECSDKQRNFSRSEWLFYVVCDLIRHSVPDDVILGIITDKRWAISAHVRDQKGDKTKYAIKQIEKAHEDVASKPPLLFAEAPLPSARLFVARRRPTLMHNNDDWLAHDGAAYTELEEKTVRSELYGFLERAMTLKDGEPRPFNPNKVKVSNVVDALQGMAHRARDIFEPPCWLEGAGPPPRELIACRNGLLHVPTAVLHEHTPRFFTRNALTFDYDASAPRPERWLAFLQTLWPDPADTDTIATLQEIFGYVLIPDTSQQKIFMLIGPKRSGKGTLARVLEQLLGKQNTCAPTLNGLGANFGLEPLIGKQLAIVGDLRLGRKTDHAAIAENLLRISGEDMVSADRKFKRAWHGRLAVRFLIMTNLLPRFADASGALANRFVPIIMTETFLGRENHGLLDELLPELPGVLNWAVDGWRRLHERGHFALPESSREAIQSLTDLASPEAAFIRDECELHVAAAQPKADLFAAWQKWCQRSGEAFSGTLDVFSARLQAAASGRVGVTKVRDGGKRVPAFKGIRLRDAEQPEQVPF